MANEDRLIFKPVLQVMLRTLKKRVITYEAR